MNKEFRFDPETHSYYLGEERLPSVSEIIAPLTDYSHVPQERLINGQEYGQAVHKAIELWLKNDLDESTLDENLKKPLDSFKLWYERICNCEGKPICIEEAKYHAKLKYAGTPDIVFQECVIDFKTRRFNKYVDTVQLAAYSNLFPEFPHKDVYVLEIETDGTMNIVKANHSQAWGVFRKLLDNYRNNQEIGKLINNWKKQ